MRRGIKKAKGEKKKGRERGLELLVFSLKVKGPLAFCVRLGEGENHQEKDKRETERRKKRRRGLLLWGGDKKRDGGL